MDAAQERIDHPRYAGFFTQNEALRRGCTLVSGVWRDGADWIDVFIIVDADQTVRDIRLRGSLGGWDRLLLDVAAELCLDRPLSQAQTISAESVVADLQLRFTLKDASILRFRSGILPPFACLGKPQETPAKKVNPATWTTLGLFEKVRLVEAALDEHVRPMLAADGGGMEVLDLKENDELVVQYSGACGSCSAALGGTLYFIEDALESALGVRLKVQVEGFGGGHDWM